MSYLASITDWLKVWGPIAYGMIGLASALIISIILVFFGKFKEKSALANFANRRSQSEIINPLEDSFIKKRLNVQDFYHPFFRPIENAKFTECEIFGPGAMIPVQCTFHDITLRECDIIVLKDEVILTSGTQFKLCVFQKCIFYRVPLYMNKGQCEAMKLSFGDKLASITYIPP